MIRIFLIALFLVSGLAQAFPYTLTYSGRLTNPNGSPVTGDVTLEAKFFDAVDAETALVTKPAETVTLQQGVFSLDITLTDAEANTIFGHDDVWIQVHENYPRQKFSVVPYALRVPVDGKTISYSDDGELRIGTSAPTVGNYLKGQADGSVTWDSPTFNVDWANPGAIGADHANTGEFSTLTSTSFSSGTIEASSQIKVGSSAITCDGANMGAIRFNNPNMEFCNGTAWTEMGSSTSIYAMAPIGTIMGWHKDFANTPALPEGWLECNGQIISDSDSPYNGQTIPDLNGESRFLRGSSTSGTEQSSTKIGQHDPSGQLHFLSNSDGTDGTNSPRTAYAWGTSGHTITYHKIRPVNMSVVWIMRVK